MLMSPDREDLAVPFALAAVAEADVDPSAPLCLPVPAHAYERASRFVAAGFVIEAERLAMVRHTTVPAVVMTGLAPIPALEGVERVPRGVPT